MSRSAQPRADESVGLARRLKAYSREVCTQMPRVTIKTGILGPDGKEEALSEFLCDVPGCPNIATEVVGCAKEIGVVVAWCEEHAAARRALRVDKDASDRRTSRR
jgi:hypothetical protein